MKTSTLVGWMGRFLNFVFVFVLACFDPDTISNERKCTLKFRLFIHSASPQGQSHYNSVSQLLWGHFTEPSVWTFPVWGNRSIQRKPTAFEDRWLYSFRTRTGSIHIEKTLVILQPRPQRWNTSALTTSSTCGNYQIDNLRWKPLEERRNCYFHVRNMNGHIAHDHTLNDFFSKRIVNFRHQCIFTIWEIHRLCQRNWHDDFNY